MYLKMIEEAAYFLWLGGSNDTIQNWIDAEKQVNEQLKRLKNESSVYR
jgi:hypothetical protein